MQENATTETTEQLKAKGTSTKITQEHKAAIMSANDLVDESAAMVVADQVTHDTATEMLIQLQTKKREIEEIRDDLLEPIADAKRSIEKARKKWVAFFQAPLDAIMRGKKALDDRCVGWRREERRKAEEEAQKRRNDELKKIQAHKDAQEKEAKKLEKKGLPEEAAELRDQTELTMPPLVMDVAPTIATPTGAHVKIVKVPEVDERLQNILLGRAVEHYNKAALAQGQARIVPAAYWQLNMKALAEYGKKTDGQIEVPGVKWVEDESTAVRRRR
ncbi:MAG: hypothetical protein GY769_08110 [bacterium]|nr:hypothetical protein [bacterium]